MKGLIVGSVLGIAAACLLGSVALAQSGHEFKLGFKALADQIPDVVGEPIEDEHWGPNGDSLQQTTAGLMVWRKADNWTAFTDGSRTWINGPSLELRSIGPLVQADGREVRVGNDEAMQTRVLRTLLDAGVSIGEVALMASGVEEMYIRVTRGAGRGVARSQGRVELRAPMESLKREEPA